MTKTFVWHVAHTRSHLPASFYLYSELIAKLMQTGCLYRFQRQLYGCDTNKLTTCCMTQCGNLSRKLDRDNCLNTVDNIRADCGHTHQWMKCVGTEVIAPTHTSYNSQFQQDISRMWTTVEFLARNKEDCIPINRNLTHWRQTEHISKHATS